MTKKQALNLFTEIHKPFNDYWAMQLRWEGFTDFLCADGRVTEKQRSTWGNPCTPETFKNFNKKFKGEC